MVSDFACYRCIKRPVDIPGHLCGTCNASDVAVAEVGSEPTAEATHERYRATLSPAAVDRVSYERWVNDRH